MNKISSLASTIAVEIIDLLQHPTKQDETISGKNFRSVHISKVPTISELGRESVHISKQLRHRHRPKLEHQGLQCVIDCQLQLYVNVCQLRDFHPLIFSERRVNVMSTLFSKKIKNKKIKLAFLLKKLLIQSYFDQLGKSEYLKKKIR